MNLGAGVNSAFLESAPSYFANDDGGAPQLFFHSARPGGLGGTDIYVSEHFPNGTWGPASLVVELSGSSGLNNIHRSGSMGSRCSFFRPDLPLAGRTVDVWAATRRSVSGALVHAGEPGADCQYRPR